MATYNIKTKRKKTKNYYEMDIGGQKVRGKTEAEVRKKVNKMQKEEAILWGYKKF